MRVNLLPPALLLDEHLIAEVNEINMISGMFKKSYYSKSGVDISKISSKYLLGPGHVYFFYNKGLYLEKRYYTLVEECKKREIVIKNKFKNVWFELGLFSGLFWYKDYQPTLEDYKIIIARIKEKVKEKPNFYNYYWEGEVHKINVDGYFHLLNCFLYLVNKTGTPLNCSVIIEEIKKLN